MLIHEFFPLRTEMNISWKEVRAHIHTDDLEPNVDKSYLIDRTFGVAGRGEYGEDRQRETYICCF